jgi:crotonobetainyl-CoA:carnitine CoA-transferase CaiB-like acyl-CoA transferase
MTGVLDGIRILDFGRYVAGPLCGALLSDFGADVIRIERVGGGEDRYLFPIAEGTDGANYLQANRNKRGFTLDIKHPRARPVLERLVASADAVISNLPQPTLVDMRLDYESLRAMKKDIILSTVSAFGPVGPYSDRVGFDGVAQAMSGVAYISGMEDRPCKSYAAWVDTSTAMMSALGIMAALRERDRTGRGQQVRNNLLKSAMTVFNSLLIDQFVGQTNREPTGNRGMSGGPADIVRTSDGWIMIQVLGDPVFRRWARLVGQPQWIEEERFSSDTKRAGHGAFLSQHATAWCAALTTSAALAALVKARIPAGPVLTPQQILDDEHVAQTEMLQYFDYPGAPRPVPIVAAMDLSETPGTLRTRAPLLGEHVDEILRDLAFSEFEIVSLRDDGVV